MESSIALISTITALFATLLGPLVSLWVTNKQVSASVLSANRQSWINNLRDLMAEYFSIVNFIHAKQWDSQLEREFDEKMARLSFLNAKIQLMLNPTEKDHNELTKAIGELGKLCSSAMKTKNVTEWHQHHYKAM